MVVRLARGILPLARVRGAECVSESRVLAEHVDGNRRHRRNAISHLADQTIEITSEAKLRDMSQYLEDRDDKPRVAAIFQTGATGNDGSSSRIAFYPIPDAVYRLKYTQINEPANITGGSHVPLGGSLHSETILASCLAIAEQFFIPNSPHGYQESYRRRLAASVELDRQAIRSEVLGYNSDPSVIGSLNRFQHPRLSRYIQDNSVTINGVQY